MRDVMLEGFRDHVEHYVKLEPVYRFPVLTHWSFTVSGSGGFQPLMLALDVGLLGTAPAAPAVPPGAPRPRRRRPAAELAETGHVGLPHLTRRGDRVRAWFRGPLAAHPTTRDAPGADGRLPFAHDSDQLRRVVPDGREDLSLAAAFEIGRLLALSQPAVVRALMAWRAEQFGAERAKQLVDALAQRRRPCSPPSTAPPPTSSARLIGRSIVLAAAQDPAKALAPSRPLVDAGRPLPFKADGGIEQLLGEGFGFSADAVVKVSQRLGPAAALRRVDVPVTGTDEGEPPLEGPAVERLRGRLSEAVDRLTASAAALGVPEVLLTLGSHGAVVFADGTDTFVPAAWPVSASRPPGRATRSWSATQRHAPTATTPVTAARNASRLVAEMLEERKRATS